MKSLLQHINEWKAGNSSLKNIKMNEIKINKFIQKMISFGKQSKNKEILLNDEGFGFSVNLDDVDGMTLDDVWNGIRQSGEEINIENSNDVRYQIILKHSSEPILIYWKSNGSYLDSIEIMFKFKYKEYKYFCVYFFIESAEHEFCFACEPTGDELHGQLSSLYKITNKEDVIELIKCAREYNTNPGANISDDIVKKIIRSLR